MIAGFSYSWWGRFLFVAFSLIFSSITIFKKLPAVLLLFYVVLTFVLLWLLSTKGVPLLKNIPQPILLTWLVLVSIVIAAAHVLLHPLLDVHGFSIAGISFGASDTDNAVEKGLEALFAGRYPYHQRTFLDAPITPMPGSLLLALPLYLIGYSALQSAVWFVAFWVLVWFVNRDFRTAVIVVVMVTVLSPNMVYHFIVGSDYMANSVAVLLGVILVARSMDKSSVRLVLSSLFLGVAAASRPNWLLALPPLFVYLYYGAGMKRSVTSLVSSAAAFLILVLPFYLYDPDGFSPFHVRHYLVLHEFIQNGDILFAVLLGALAFVLAFKGMNQSEDRLIRVIAVVQVASILSGFLLKLFLKGEVDLYYSHLGLLFLPIVVFSFGPGLVGADRQLPASSAP